MGRKVDVDDLVGADEVAARLGLTRAQRVHELRARHDDFPDPIATFQRAHVWLWPDIEKWARRHGRL